MRVSDYRDAVRVHARDSNVYEEVADIEKAKENACKELLTLANRYERVPMQITLYGRTAPGDGRCQQKREGSQEVEALGEFDMVLLALPPAAVRMMTTPPSWHSKKREAIRAMRYVRFK
jgi:hypothetical protein